MHKFYSAIFGFLFISAAHASMFGEENIALGKLVLGQIEEIKQLSDAVGVGQEELETLGRLNEGVERITHTIESIEEIKERIQGLNPKSIHRISDLSNLIWELKRLKRDVNEIITVRLAIADEAINQAGAQSETAYLMGQEMAVVGSDLSQEAKTASPGRAAQISASANANTMLSQGVELQTLAHIAQLQALSLDLQKAQIEHTLNTQDAQSALYLRRIGKNNTPTQLVARSNLP